MGEREALYLANNEVARHYQPLVDCHYGEWAWDVVDMILWPIFKM